MTTGSDPAAPAPAPPRESLRDLSRRLDGTTEHLDERYHEIIRKADAILAAQAELIDTIRPYIPLLDRIAHLAAGPAGKLMNGGPLAAILAKHGKKGTPPDGQ